MKILAVILLLLNASITLAYMDNRRGSQPDKRKRRNPEPRIPGVCPVTGKSGQSATTKSECPYHNEWSSTEETPLANEQAKNMGNSERNSSSSENDYSSGAERDLQEASKILYNFGISQPTIKKTGNSLKPSGKRTRNNGNQDEKPDN